MNELHKNLKKSLENTERQLDMERESSQTLKAELKLRISELNAAREPNQQIQAFHASALQEKDALIHRLSSSVCSSFLPPSSFLFPFPPFPSLLPPSSFLFFSSLLPPPSSFFLLFIAYPLLYVLPSFLLLPSSSFLSPFPSSFLLLLPLIHRLSSYVCSSLPPFFLPLFPPSSALSSYPPKPTHHPSPSFSFTVESKTSGKRKG